MHSPFRNVIVLIAILSTGTSFLFPQSNEEIYSNYQFSFSSPGARARAMGGAFIGLAADATAAVSNPAGLIGLDKPQLYFEYKHANLRTRRIAGGNPFNDPTAYNMLRTCASNPSTSQGCVNDTAYFDYDALSFLNYSHPIISDRLVLSFTYYQFLNNELGTNSDYRAVPGDSGAALFPNSLKLDLNGTTYAGSVAYRIADQLSVGGSINVDHLDLSAEQTRFAGVDPVSGSIDARFPPVQLNQTSVAGTKTEVSFNLGVLYQPHELVALGLTYAKGSKFKFSNFSVSNNMDLLGGSAGLTEIATTSLPFNVPDRIGFGLKFQPHDRLLFLFDAVRVNYSQLVDEDFVNWQMPLFELQFDQLVAEAIDSGFSRGEAEEIANISAIASLGGPFTIVNDWDNRNYDTQDATEIRVGGEFEFLSQDRVRGFARGGFFTNPDHRLRFNGPIGGSWNYQPQELSDEDLELLLLFLGLQQADLSGTGIPLLEDIEDGLFNVGSKEMLDNDFGKSVGVGFDFGDFDGFVSGFQVDAAYASVDTFDEVVISVAVRF